MFVDQKFSHTIFQATKRSPILRPLAIFGATSLLFVMITAVVFMCAPGDCDVDLFTRIKGNILTLGLPLVLTWLVVVAIQHLVKRERPPEEQRDAALIKMVWEAPSFPSAHTALAFATASVSFFLQGTLMSPWLFVAAAIVGLSRVAVGVHYMSDIIFGALVGFVVGSAGLFGLLWLAFINMA